MAIPNIVPRGNDDGETLGTSTKAWSNVYTKDLTVNGSSLTTLIAGKADASTVSTHTAQLAGTADSALKEQIAQNTSDIADRVEYDDVLTLEEIEASTSLTDTDVASASALKEISEFESLQTTYYSSNWGMERSYGIKYGKHIHFEACGQVQNTQSATIPFFMSSAIKYAPTSNNVIGSCEIDGTTTNFIQVTTNTTERRLEFRTNVTSGNLSAGWRWHFVVDWWLV